VGVLGWSSQPLVASGGFGGGSPGLTLRWLYGFSKNTHF